jgi:hypothetical protein
LGWGEGGGGVKQLHMWPHPIGSPASPIRADLT